MKHTLLILLGLILIPVGANATEVSKEQANTYYESCSSQSDPRFSQETQKLFCACTAVQLMKDYTVEDMQASARQDQAGRDAVNKMITNVYAPCIKYPARDYHYSTCKADPKSGILGNAENICSCSADQVAAHLDKNAQTMLANILKKTPNITDPMQALYDDKQFQKYIQSKVMGCVTR